MATLPGCEVPTPRTARKRAIRSGSEQLANFLHSFARSSVGHCSLSLLVCGEISCYYCGGLISIVSRFISIDSVFLYSGKADAADDILRLTLGAILQSTEYMTRVRVRE